MARFSALLSDIDHIRIFSLSDVFVSIPPAEEPFNSVLKNAMHKALHYASYVHDVVIANDSGLFFDFLEEKDQPGALVRRTVGNDDVSDASVRQYYMNLFQQQPEETVLSGYWLDGIVVANAHGCIRQFSVRRPCIFLREPVVESIPGYPLSSLCIDLLLQKPWASLTHEEKVAVDMEYFKDFITFMKEYKDFE